MNENLQHEGETVTFECDASRPFVHGNPRTYVYTWKRDGIILLNVADITKDTLEFSMSQADDGDYTCIVWNDYGETEESDPVELIFILPPQEFIIPI